MGTATPLTDFNYAGMFYNADSGLNLTKYRAYDPVAGRWLSRDPFGEFANLSENLYSYVDGDPVDSRDPLGLWGIAVAVGGSADIGAGGVGAGATASAGYGIFGRQTGGQANFEGYVSAGAFAGGPGYGLQYPNYAEPDTATGAFAGYGAGGFLTNACAASDLAGPFEQYNLNLAFVSIQFAISGSTWILSASSGPGIGFGNSTYPTNTWAGK